MNTALTANDNWQSSPAGTARRFAIAIRREEHGPELKRAPVLPAEMQGFKHQLLLASTHRRGMPAASLQDVTIEMTPILGDQEHGSRCQGLRVDVVNPQGDKFQRDYDVRLFADVARRAVAELVAEGVLKPDDSYVYELVVDQSVSALPGREVANISFVAVSEQEPPRYLTRPLRTVMARAEPIGEPTDKHFPVFYTAVAYDRAERFARRGAATVPPRETGAALVGTACSCPESGEFYLVVTDALEATDAEEDKLSLLFTGKTWRRLQVILKSIQSQPESRTYRLLGQAHGHNFIPLAGAPPCDLCDTAKVCSRTSVFVSSEDRTWTQAVFAGVPFCLCHIFGLNARHEEVQGLYSLHDNRLTERGFYVIPDFDPIPKLHSTTPTTGESGGSS